MGLTERARKVLTPVLLLAVTPGLPGATPRRHIMYLRAEPGVLNQRLAAFPSDSARQILAIQHQFDQIGVGKGICRPEQQPRGLVCTVPGQGSAVVLVVAFLPRADKHRQMQVEDAPLVLLPLLAESAIGVERKATHIFAALESDADQKTALRGLIDSIQGSGQRTVSIVVLVSQVGRAQPIVGCVKRDSLLQQALAGTASTMNVAIKSENLSPCPAILKELDSTFSDRRVLITSPGSQSVPNPAGFGHIAQELTALDPKAYYLTYEYLCTFLAYLDTSLTAPAAAGATPADEDINAEVRACFEQARASRGLPGFASNASLDAFARRRIEEVSATDGAAVPEPASLLDAKLRASGFIAKEASETVNSVAVSDREQLCSSLLTNRLALTAGPVVLAVGAEMRGQRIFAVAELAIPPATTDVAGLKEQVVAQIHQARQGAGKPPMTTSDRSFLDSLACEVSALKEPSLDPVKDRLKREHMRAHIVIFQGLTAGIPEEQLATLRDSTDDRVSVGACRNEGGVATVVILTDQSR